MTEGSVADYGPVATAVGVCLAAVALYINGWRERRRKTLEACEKRVFDKELRTHLSIVVTATRDGTYEEDDAPRKVGSERDSTSPIINVLETLAPGVNQQMYDEEIARLYLTVYVQGLLKPFFSRSHVRSASSGDNSSGKSVREDGLKASMHDDVVDLRDFYGTSLGQVAQRMIRRRVRLFWPHVQNLRVLGVGYATPYLRPFLGEAERVMALMPAAQGVIPWPREGPNAVALSDEGELPLGDNAVDRVLLVHALEGSEQVRPLLREVWRVLAGGGRLLVVAPNRRGIWARVDRTPFGRGHPYTPGQLSRLLREERFTPERAAAALFVPPTGSRMILRSAGAWESVGERWFTRFAGVAMIEATKQIYAAKPLAARARRRRGVLSPATVPQGVPG